MLGAVLAYLGGALSMYVCGLLLQTTCGCFGLPATERPITENKIRVGANREHIIDPSLLTQNYRRLAVQHLDKGLWTFCTP